MIPWSPEVITWPLLEVIDASLDLGAVVPPLANHLGHFSPGPGERELRLGAAIRSPGGWPDCSPPTPASDRIAGRMAGR